MFKATHVQPLEKNDYQFGDPIIRLPNKVMKTEQFRRREPVIIECTDNPSSPKILRFAMGIGGGVKGFTNNSIALDYDGGRQLGLSRDTEPTLAVRRATRHEVFMWYWDHDSPVVRMGIRMGALSVGLGVIGAVGVVVSIMSLFM